MYDPNTGYLKKLREENRTKLRQFNGEPDEGAREEILRTLIGKIGDKCFVTPNFFFYPNKSVLK